MDLGEKFVIRSNSLEPKQGKILISEPLMNDFHFGRSVILLIDHVESEGSFGVIINKKLNASVSQIVDDFPDFEGTAYLGGPVSDSQLFFIHTLGELIPESIIANEENTRFYLGYAGWDSGQLVDELVRNTWLVSDITVEQYLNTPPELMWSSFVQKLGKPYEMWNRFPKNYEDN